MGIRKGLTISQQRSPGNAQIRRGGAVKQREIEQTIKNDLLKLHA